jgi:biopolymer transport protein ExbD
MEFRRKRRDVISMDITPLVDVVFLLLIFFMLSTTFIVSPGIRINLPEAKAEPVRRESRDFRVKIDQQGLLYIGDRKVEIESLVAELEQAAARDRDTLVVIEADEQSMHGYVVDIMDRAKTAGLNRLAIATRPRQ